MSEPAAIAQQFLSLGDTQQKVIAFQALTALRIIGGKASSG